MKKLFIIVISISLFTSLSYKANATDVGGIISSDTIWSITGSPYNVTSLIQIAPNATVTIEPGVIINRAGGAHIQVFGGLIAIGTEISKIIINDIRIYGEDDNLTLPIHVEYTVFNDGGFSTGYCKKI